MRQPTRPTRRGLFGAIATAALFASLLPGVAAAAGPATHLAFIAQPSTTAAGATITPAVTVAIQDASNATVTTDNSTVVTVAISSNPGGGTLAGTITATASSGIATFSTLSINNAGVGYTLFASGASLSGATSASFTIVGPATKLAFTTQPSTTSVGASITPAVTVAVQDVNGQVVTTSSANVTVALGANPGGGTLGGTLTVAAASGVASFGNLTMSNSGVGKTLVATSGSLTSATSNPFTIVGTPTQLAFGTQPSNTSANAPISPVVTIRILDANNQLVTNSSASVSMAIATNPSSGTLSGTLTVAAVNGIATFGSLSINNPGIGYTLAASSTGLTGATSTAFNITLNQHLAFTTQPGGGGPGAIWAQQPVVAVQNSLNATVTSDNTTVVTLAIGTNPAGGTLTCTSGLSRTVVNGVATFYGCSINFASPYTYTLSATSSPAWTVATSAAFLIGSTQHLAFTTQPGGGGAGAIWLQQPVVAVQNASNAVVTTDYSTVVTLAIATNPAGGTLTCTSGLSRTVVAGVATFSGCSINLASASYYTLSATSNPVWTAATSGSFLIGSTQHLAFSTQPGGGGAGAIWLQQPVVSVQNSLNQVVTSDYSTVVTLAIATNPALGTLS
ncbi:MAG: beta strand repeat-containing protein, partial [Candidatus Limnocylindrales bacterium]